MSEQQALKPQFFVTRQNGAMVPLIAMDELPIHLQLRHVPRLLDPYNIAGMTSVGVFESRHRFYVVESLNNAKSSFIDSIHALPSVRGQVAMPKASFPEASDRTSVPRRPVLSPAAPPKAFGVEEQPPSVTGSSTCVSSNDSLDDKSMAAENNKASNLPPTAHVIPASKSAPACNNQDNLIQSKVPPGGKEYCSFWIRRGECDYAQQGCVYKHEMPLDLVTLERIGHRDIPRWYREKYGLGSLLVAGGKAGPSFGVADPKAVERKWRVSDDAKRMICHGLGVPGVGQGARQGGRNHNKNRNVTKDRGLDAMKTKEEREKEDKEREKELMARKLSEAEENERKALAAKYKVLRPDHRSIFDHDLDSDTFSNGEEPNDLMAKIRAREQAGWDKEKAQASILNASVASSTVASKQTDLGKEKRGGRRHGGRRQRKHNS